MRGASAPTLLPACPRRLERPEMHEATAHFHAGHNLPGYLPESEPATFAIFEDAKSDMLWTLNNHADSVDSWTDEHDCDDVPCPTYGDDCGHDKANSLSLAAEDLNLNNGPEWSDVSAGQSYWITACCEPDCAPDDDDVECGACPASSCVHHTCPNCGRWTQFDPCPYCPNAAA